MGMTSPFAQRGPGVWTFTADMLNVPGGGPAVGVIQLGPVAVSSFSMTQTLSDFGAGEAVIETSGPGLTRADLQRLWGWRLWAYYEGQPVFCGFPTGLADSGGATVAISLTEVTGYLAHRAFDVRNPLTSAQGGGYGQVYDNTEQTVIAADLAAPLADILVPVVHQPGGGQLRDRTYAFLENNRAELLKALAEVSNGPQFRTEYAMTAGLPAATFRIAYPRVGADTGMGAAIPGGVLDFTLTWDSDMLRTWTWAIGDLPQNAPEGAQKPVRRVIRPQPNAGIPARLDAIDEWAGVWRVTTLENRANTNATLYASPVLTIDVTVGTAEPPLTAYQVGDTVTLHFTDPLLAGTVLESAGQLTAREVSAGDGTVAWTVTVKQPPPKPRETVAGALARLDNFASLAWRRSMDAEVDIS